MQPADRTEPKRHSRGGAILAGLLWAAGAHAAGDTGVVSSQLPDMGSPENAVLSKTDEYQIGLMAMRELRSQELILEDPELTDYIQHLGSRLAAQARADDQNFQYFIIRSSEINAFATYGGFICVTPDSSCSRDRVGPGRRAGARDRPRAPAPYRACDSGAEPYVAEHRGGDARGDADRRRERRQRPGHGGRHCHEPGHRAPAGDEFQPRRGSRGGPRRYRPAGGAGFRTNAMADFFESMGRREGVSEQAGPLDMLRNHPVTRDRIAEARSRASNCTSRRSTNRSCTRGCASACACWSPQARPT